MAGLVCWRTAMLVVVISAIAVFGRDTVDLDFDSQDASINELQDQDTGDDMQAFDNAYGSEMVDKVVDQDFDPEKMFSDMEKLGESRARKSMQDDDADEQDDTDLEPEGTPTMHRADVNTAVDQLQQQADLAVQIAKHPERFHDLVPQPAEEEDDMRLLGESDQPKAVENRVTKA
jgi:hypothetical protein